ncbi:phosphoribosylglycinamide formyltransferase [Helcococcus kunzii]|uniref:Phosphoribosylglycinamide formyltransferase n=1 Tax=Helcococcus kunzii ATCC 51366 TaxID=883114 RepID=H3NMF9_9FIRM|nr:phosphoribosylglycinamide formyltransferase [Helcococcus kunzii]EHR35045.1 phosphoribosylglycinamide formyltransferase [Helcococcus kunzii ATCC 51366]QUY64470.1 phosphoribosylglycinamide formyltransferase [Helcococcus kunzii]QZO76882.1 phosphoribosylglycinamide formyltransferase [Helcococcus kunzii]
MIDVAVFASGTGSNLVNLVQNEELKNYINIKLLVCDNPKAKVIERAKELGVETLVFNPKEYSKKIDFEKMLLEQVKDFKYLLLAGYMRVISTYFLENYEGKIINIHPSLLPLYKGINSIERAYNNKDEEIGVTIHFVNEEVDGGEILAQDKFTVDYNKSLEDITQQVHKLEHRLYPNTLIELLRKEN